MALTTDPQDPRLNEERENGLQEAYLVLSDEERAKGFVRPLRKTYVHHFMKDGSPVPLVLLNEHLPLMGGCGAETTMATAIAETYAVNPSYYSATYCTGCRTHLPVNEFHWDGSSEVVGS
jgi:hypothetical protein